ncbi:MAG: adenosine deaminase, partial [Ktedonobacteraceae bacterium]|nr:adenosine deaminase [Ktedonobacteraceae bacterium]
PSLPRAFYTRPTLQVARALLGTTLVHQLPSGERVGGRIVETEAYAGQYDPASHTYRNKRTARNAIWYEEGGHAYVYTIYGIYVCLGIITEAEGIPGAVLIRALEPTLGVNLLARQRDHLPAVRTERLCAGPSKLCIAMQIDRRCHGLDLCGQQLFLQEAEEAVGVEDIVFGPRINIDYAGAGAIFAWRYYLRQSPAISKKPYEPLRAWRTTGYPSQRQLQPLDLVAHLAQKEEEVTMQQDTPQQFSSLPKIELHLHLEGMMRLHTLRVLCHQNRQPLPAHLQQDETTTFGSFDEFVYTYHLLGQALAREQDFALLMVDVADYLKRNQILYAEISWTPFLYLNRGLRFEAVMAVLNEALETHGIADRVQWLIDIQRDHGLEAGAWVYQQVCAARSELQIAGVGLTGQEAGFPPAEYHTLFQQARDHGLGTTAHAGEYGTPKDIWQCIEHLEVSRIGHGIRAVEDRALLQQLKARQIHLELCPTSNVRLQRVPTYSTHPIQALWRAGIALGINTDNPGLFRMDLAEEYARVMAHCGFSLHDVWQTLQHSVQAAFLAPKRKRTLLHQLDAAWHRALTSGPTAEHDKAPPA